jgi:hypothetical protein
MIKGRKATNRGNISVNVIRMENEMQKKVQTHSGEMAQKKI